MIMVKVFKTDVQYVEEVENIINMLLRKYSGLRITFDLEDEDKILRVEGAFFKAEDVVFCLKEQGYYCVNLPIDLNLTG